MPNGFIGYDPALVAQLDARVRTTITDLVSLRADDPAAGAALDAVALARSHLETGWIPLLDRIRSNAGMVVAIEALPIDGLLGFLRDDPLGQLVFDLIDVADQGDLDEMDGNWSTDDVAAATDPARVRDLVEDAVGRGLDPGPGGTDALVATVTAVASRLGATDEQWESIDDEVGWYEDAAGFAIDIAGDVWDRAATYGQYLYESRSRMAGDPLQTIWDVSSGTFFVEQAAAAEAILVEDGELYTDDDGRCGTQGECITGARPLPGAGATTFGHTVVIADDEPSERLVRHEFQHVDDIETFGATAFYTSYVGHFAWNMAAEVDDIVDGESLDDARDDAYHDVIWEQRAEEAEG